VDNTPFNNRVVKNEEYSYFLSAASESNEFLISLSLILGDTRPAGLACRLVSIFTASNKAVYLPTVAYTLNQLRIVFAQ
jgi:hypothetical protein